MYHYFDSYIDSQVELDELAGAAGSDVPVVSVEAPTGDYRPGVSGPPSHRWYDENGCETLSLHRENRRYVLEFPSLGCFSIDRSGKSITASLAPGVPTETFSHLLLDQVLPRYFVHFHGYSVFHGALVSVYDRGFCFLGKSGWGKSTLAAAFSRAGHTVLTDDCLALQASRGTVAGVPGYSSMRLLPDSLAALIPAGQTVSPVADYTAKKRLLVQRAIREPLPIHGVYLLAPPAENSGSVAPWIERVRGMQAIAALLEDTFCLDPNDQRWARDHFTRVSALLSTGLPVYKIHYPRNYEIMPAIISMIS